MLKPRKLLAVALPLTFAAACGHASPARAPVARAVSMPVPVVAAVSTVADVTPVPAPVLVAATPMCDGDGRPLAGNTTLKNARVCATEVAEAR